LAKRRYNSDGPRKTPRRTSKMMNETRKTRIGPTPNGHVMVRALCESGTV